MQYGVYNINNHKFPYEWQDQDAGTQTPAVYDTKPEADEVCAWLNKMSERFGHKARYEVREFGEAMYYRIKQMTKYEMRKFIHWVYLNGKNDGAKGRADSELGFFGGAILDYPSKTLENLWNPLCNTDVKGK